MDTKKVWWRDGIVYQIYPRSFADSNGDGIGDLNGIIGRLDDLQTFGVDAIWLSPIYPSPGVDVGYDVSDYCDIDPNFGTMADFDRLLEEAHKRNIHIILDLVLNHTSDQHPWFLESKKSKDNPFSDYYLWLDPAPDGGVPNNWQSVFGGKGWEYSPERGQYYFHMFYKQQPDLNWRNPKVRQAIMDVFRFWLDKGVDGFRLDVFNAYFKDDQYRNNPYKPGIRPFDMQRHIYDSNRPEIAGVVAEIRSIMDAYADRYVVGETFLGGGEMAAQYIGDGKLHAAFNFEMLHSPWQPGNFQRLIQNWETLNLNANAWPNVVMNNHDNPRSATRYCRDEDDARMKVGAALLLTQRGTPFLYYGEEIGMRDIPVRSREDVIDPLGKHYWPFNKGRDGCRSPMQWDTSTSAGFSSTDKPWLPVHENFRERNLAAQKSDPDSLYHFYRRLIHLRREEPALVHGMFQPLTDTPRRLMAYVRQTNDELILVALNFGRRPCKLFLGQGLSKTGWKLLLSSGRTEVPAVEGGAIVLKGHEALILKRL